MPGTIHYQKCDCTLLSIHQQRSDLTGGHQSHKVKLPPHLSRKPAGLSPRAAGQYLKLSHVQVRIEVLAEKLFHLIKVCCVEARCQHRLCSGLYKSTTLRSQAGGCLNSMPRSGTSRNLETGRRDSEIVGIYSSTGCFSTVVLLPRDRQRGDV